MPSSRRAPSFPRASRRTLPCSARSSTSEAGHRGIPMRQITMSKTARLPLAAIAAAGLAFNLTAQQENQPAQPVTRAEAPVLREGVRTTVQVTAMDLDVVVTKGGRPVEDLKKDEFVVKVDGKTYPLDYFARVDAGTLHGPDLATAS